MCCFSGYYRRISFRENYNWVRQSGR
nr:unnamed protein product [Callosobruchus chinensis]